MTAAGYIVSSYLHVAGMGRAEAEFGEISSFSWTLGGTGTVKITKVQNVTLNKTPKVSRLLDSSSLRYIALPQIQLEIDEVTGVLRCDNLAEGEVTVRKANILMMHDTCKSKVKVEECNCLIMLKDGSSTEYTVGGGEVVAVEHGNITLNKGAAVTLKSFNSKSEGLLEGEEAAKDFVDKRHGGGATLNDV